MGRKWTEQHELEMPETDDSCSTANNSLVIADENDGEGPGNKTVIDNSVNQWIVNFKNSGFKLVFSPTDSERNHAPSQLPTHNRQQY
jgi:hypothetical protein